MLDIKYLFINLVGKDINASGICENLLSSHLCSNKNEAKLMDLVWCQGDKRLCVIHPQVEFTYINIFISSNHHSLTLIIFPQTILLLANNRC